MSSTMTGGCACGAVTYAIEGSPLFAGKCYCNGCRKSSRTGHSALIGVLEGACNVSGELTEYSVEKENSTAIKRFCPACGTMIATSSTKYAGIVSINAATLDDPEMFKPQFSVFASCAPSWDPVSSDIPAFPEAPPSGKLTKRPPAQTLRVIGCPLRAELGRSPQSEERQVHAYPAVHTAASG